MTTTKKFTLKSGNVLTVTRCIVPERGGFDTGDFEKAPTPEDEKEAEALLDALTPANCCGVDGGAKTVSAREVQARAVRHFAWLIGGGNN